MSLSNLELAGKIDLLNIYNLYPFGTFDKDYNILNIVYISLRHDPANFILYLPVVKDIVTFDLQYVKVHEIKI